MMGYSDGLNVQKAFVFSYDDFKGEPRSRNDFTHETAGLEWDGLPEERTPLEVRLHQHPEDFENRFDRIK